VHDYDIALKLALQGSAGLVLHTLTGVQIERWLNVELPEVRNSRVDLLGETSDQRLIHIELQSRNDSNMAVRMAEYCLSVYCRYRKFPSQMVMYVGEDPLRMDPELSSPDLSFRYKQVDIREIDGDALLDSDQVGDNVIAILARLRDRAAAVRRIVERIAILPEQERETPLDQLRILAGLRKLEDLVEQEVGEMPITEDIRNHKVFRREYGEGVQQGELTILRRQIEKRFGPIPAWAAERLESCSVSELEALSERVLDALSLKDLLP
jgi:hypothetical protein